MPESPIVPRGRTIRPVPLPAGALEQIRARAHHRRAARAAAAGSAGAMALALGAAAVVSGAIVDDRDDSLRLGPAASTAPSPSTLQSPSVRELARPRADDSAVRLAPPESASGARQAQAAPQRTGGLGPGAAAPASSPALDPAGYDPDAAPIHKTNVLLLPDCEHTGGGRAFSGWCLSAMSDTGNERLLMTVCRARSQARGRLSWTTSQQVRFEIADDAGAVVWTYDPVVRPQPSAADVEPDTCIGWEVPWALVDERGERLDEGRYTLRAGTTAAALATTTVTSTFYVRAAQPVPPSPPTSNGGPPSCLHVRVGGAPAMC